jgi:conjugal transfer pilus assembly protein TraI
LLKHRRTPEPRSGAWQVNQRQARLWYGVDGLYLVWRSAANEILDLLRLDRIPGVPQDRDTLCELLVRAAVIEPDAQGNALRTIDSPCTPGTEGLAVVKIRNPDLLFRDSEDVPAALREFLERRPAPPAALPNASACVTAAQPAAPAAPDPPQASTAAPDTSDARINRPAARAAAAPPQAAAPGTAVATEFALRPQLPGAVAQLLARLPRTTADLMRLLLEEYRAGERRMIFQTGEGIAVVADYMNSHGVSGPEAAKHLLEAGWLYRDPKRSNARAHTVEIEGKPVQCFVLSGSIARVLGFS